MQSFIFSVQSGQYFTKPLYYYDLLEPIINKYINARKHVFLSVYVLCSLLVSNPRLYFISANVLFSTSLHQEKNKLKPHKVCNFAYYNLVSTAYLSSIDDCAVLVLQIHKA